MKLNDIIRYKGVKYRVIRVWKEIEMASAVCCAIDGTIVETIYIERGIIMNRKEMVAKRKAEILAILEGFSVTGLAVGKTVQPLVSKQKQHALRQEYLALEEAEGADDVAA